MAIDRKLVPCDEADPNRCQAMGMNKEGQCKFLAVEGEKYCPAHSGVQSAMRKEKQKLHDYRLQVWQTRLNEFSESENVKNLRGEIGVLRLLVEEILNQCQDSHDLLLYSGKLGDLVIKIERLAGTCDKFETRVGLMLDRSAALMLAGRIVDVISKEITDPASVDRISNGIIDIISSLGNVSNNAEELGSNK